MKKTTLRVQLFKRLFILLFLMALIAISGIVVTNILKKTSARIAFEYIELNAVQELRLSFNKTFIPAYNYLLYHDEQEIKLFKSRMDSTHWHLENCKKILANRHSKELLLDFEEFLSYFEHVVIESVNSDIDLMKNRELIPLLEGVIDNATKIVEHILFETKHEIDEFIVMNSTAVSHSTKTIIFLSIIFILLGFIAGSLFVRQIVRPLKKLVLYTKEVANGNWEIQSITNQNNELDDLSEAFNQMVNDLQLTTVSRDLFNNILTGMQELIVVTDVDGKIVMVNNSATVLLGYHENELTGKPVQILFQEKLAYTESNLLRKLNEIKNKGSEYVTSSGGKIPIYLSHGALHSKNSEFAGFVLVATDITEKLAVDKKLELIRRRTTIDLNDAQEKERLRIAKELHDGLGQMLTGIYYYIENYFRDKFESDHELSIHLNNIQNQLDASIKETKNIAYNLIPMQLKDFGLSAAITNLVDRLNVQQKTKFEFSEFNFQARLDEKLEIALYRIIQEASNNIVKHARAKSAQIQLIRHDDSVSIIIIDDGIGFDFANINHGLKKQGIGLSSIQERVTSFDGFLNITSNFGSGTEILIEIPNE